MNELSNIEKICYGEAGKLSAGDKKLLASLAAEFGVSEQAVYSAIQRACDKLGDTNPTSGMRAESRKTSSLVSKILEGCECEHPESSNAPEEKKEVQLAKKILDALEIMTAGGPQNREVEGENPYEVIEKAAKELIKMHGGEVPGGSMSDEEPEGDEK